MSNSIDPDELKRFSFNVWGFKQGEMVSLMIHIGDRLGLYQALAGAGPVTAGELAAKTGLKERWLLEWLRGQAAARLLNYSDGDRFELSPVGAAVLADEEGSLAFAAGAFSSPIPPADHGQAGGCLPHRHRPVLRGVGPQRGPSHGAHAGPLGAPSLGAADSAGVGRRGGQAHPRGAVVADVGCGGGLAIAAMAEAYPNSEFHGYDPSQHAIDRCREKVAEQGLKNLKTFVAGGEALPQEATYDFLITFDCIHDMTRPGEVIAAIRRALKPDGTWLIKDIRSTPDFKQNMRNPMLAMFYGFSVSACMSSALSEPDGAGLGTLGFNPAVAEDMVRQAGFSRFRMHDFDDPSNLYYEVRV